MTDRLPALPEMPFCRARSLSDRGVLQLLNMPPDAPLFDADQMRSYAATAVAQALEEAAQRCEAIVSTLRLPDAPTYPGDERPTERRVVLGIAAAIRARGAKGEAA